MRPLDSKIFSKDQFFAVTDDNKGTDGVFFNVESYRGKILPLEQLIEETYTYFSEHLKVPTIRRAYWNGSNWRHPDGTSYDDVFDQAITTAQRSDIHKRYEFEKKGWESAGSIANHLKPFLIISLPGTVYRNKYGANNMTYYADPVGREGDEVVYDILSIPSEEMSGDIHAEVVLELVGEVLERDPDLLVSSSFVVTGGIGALNDMCERLGHLDYNNLQKVARKSLESQDDPKSWVRRNQMVEYFAGAIHDAQTNVFMSDSKKMTTQGAISEAMRYFFAMEAGSSYSGKEFAELESKISSYILDGITKKSIEQNNMNHSTRMTDEEKLNLWQIRERDGRRMFDLTSNKKALNSYRVIACNTIRENETGGLWNEYKIDPLSSNPRMDVYGNEINSGPEEENKELSDGETACYPCPLCGGEVKRQGGDLVCQKNPEQHHIKYQSQTD